MRSAVPVRRITFICLALLAWASDAHAGPWTKGLGEFYVKVGEGFFLSDSYVDSTGKTVEGTSYLGATTSIYAEVGIYKGLQLIAYLPYTIAQNTFSSGRVDSALNVGGGDAVFAVQYSPPLPISFPFALKVDVKVPLYDVGGIKGFDANSFPAFGDGQVDVGFWVSAGHSLGSIPLYFFAEVGYRLRTEAFIGTGNSNSFADGFVFSAQIGYTLFKRVLLAANVGGVVAFDMSDTSLEGQVTKSYITVGPSLYIPLWRGLAAEASFDPIVYSRNSAAGMGFSFGLSYKR
jgi:hypothetical protein